MSYYCKECGIPLHHQVSEFPESNMMTCIVCKRDFDIEDEKSDGFIYVRVNQLNKAVEQLLDAAIPEIMTEMKQVRELNEIQIRKLEEVGYGHFSMQEWRLKHAEETRDAWANDAKESKTTIEALRAENGRLVNEINDLLLKRSHEAPNDPTTNTR